MTTIGNVRLTIPFKDINRVYGEIIDNEHLIKTFLINSFDEHNDTIERYVELSTTVAILNEPKMKNYIADVEEVQKLLDVVEIERAAIRDVISGSGGNEKKRAADGVNFDKFDLRFNIFNAKSEEK